MAEATEFDEFVTARSARLLRLAYLLTQDHALAEDLLQTALARSWSAWRRIDGDPEPYVRRVLVNAHNSWWRRRTWTEQPVDELPVMATTAPQTEVDDRDQVWRALRRLPQQQRAVLVLRYFEDLSEDEIAGTLGIAAGTVKSYAAKGIAKLRVDPSLQALPLPEPIDTPAGTERLVAVRDRIRRRRRDKIVAAATAVGLVVALLIGYALAPHLRNESLPPAGPFHEYIDGRRVVAARSADFAELETASFVWVPTTLDMSVFITCHHELADMSLLAYARIGDYEMGEFGCYSDQEIKNMIHSTTPSPDFLRSIGVEVGRPSTVSIVVRPAPGHVMPEHGTVAVGIGEAVPFDEYPLPDRPGTLVPLPNTHAELPNVTVIDAARPGGTTAVWDGTDLTFQAQSQTPGALVLKVNGIPVWTWSWWDYEQRTKRWTLTIAGARSSPLADLYGGTVTISIEPQHMTGDWYVDFQPT